MSHVIFYRVSSKQVDMGPKKLEEILDEKLKAIKDEFLAPMKESLSNLRQAIQKNTEDIAECKAAIENIKKQDSSNQSGQPFNYAKEISWQLKLVNRICVLNAMDENEVRETIKAILGSDE